MPPTPKHHSVRARANKTMRATLTDRDPADVEIPELPKLYTEEVKDKYGRTVCKPQLIPWHPLTVAWWKAIWPSPMAAEWHSSDVYGLYALAILYDEFFKSRKQTDHAEMRLARAPYGLTPIDRRRLEWSIESADKAVDEGEKRRQAQSVAPSVPNTEDDLRLRVV